MLAVLAGGFWTWKSGQEKKAEVGQWENQQAENQKQALNQQVEIDTSDWKTYRDEKYGFEIRYNPAWEIRDAGISAFGGEWLSIHIPENPSVIIQINRREFKKGYLEWIRNQMNPLVGKGVKMEIIGDILMNNDINAWHVISSDDIQTFKAHDYYISNKKTIIVIHFSEIYEKEVYSGYLSDFGAMVHSIKFLY